MFQIFVFLIREWLLSDLGNSAKYPAPRNFENQLWYRSFINQSLIAIRG